MFEEATAAELAAALDQVQTMDLTYTGPLSMADEATLRWAGRYPELAPAHRRFAEAWTGMRDRQVRGLDATAERQQVRQAAAALAEQLRQFGDTRLMLCTEPAGWGACGGVLDDDGNCTSPHVHLASGG